MNKKTLLTAVKLLGMGWYVATSILVGVVAGVFVDRWLGSSPIATLVGLFLGLAVAFWGVWRMVEPLFGESAGKSKEKDNEEDE